MRPTDIFLYLIGNRGAIERVAGSWWSLLIGAILVLTSGIARNYDHLDLLKNPEWIYGPFLASAITSLIVYAVIKAYLKLNGCLTPIKRRQYVSFLCLYWMTAPCAWIYGIPVESFTSLIIATQWNIAFLAVVSSWRVFLITRALTILTQASPMACLLAVLLPASAIMFVASFFKGLSLIGIMGGVRLPPHTQLLHDAAQFTLSASLFLTLITFFVAISAIRLLDRAQKPLPWRKEKMPTKAVLLSVIYLMIWAAASYPTQIKVQRNHQLETLLNHRKFEKAIQYASQFKKEDFSTIHYLPPDPYGRNTHSYYQLLSKFDGSEPKWLRDTWIKQYGKLCN